MIVKLSIYRYDPRSNNAPGYDSFEVDAETGDTVLSALIKVYETIDPSLSFRFACGKVKCGECGIMVNKSPCLACNKRIEQEMIIEPLPNLPVIKDLVIDRNQVLNEIFERAPVLLKSRSAVHEAGALDSETNDTYVALTTCFECLVCQSMCPVLQKGPGRFIGPLGLLWLSRANLIHAAPWDEMRDQVEMCSRCGECWKACPSQTRFLEGVVTGLIDRLK